MKKRKYIKDSDELIEYIQECEDDFISEGVKNDLLKIEFDDRIITIGEINRTTVLDAYSRISLYNRFDSRIAVENRIPIVVQIASPGGDMYDLSCLVNVIEASVTPVYTFNISYAMSAGFEVFLAGHKRFAFKDSKFLVHDGEIEYTNSICKSDDMMKFVKRCCRRSRKYVINKTKITEAMMREKERVEWYLFAEDAKKLGIVDYIVGEDVKFEDLFERQRDVNYEA